MTLPTIGLYIVLPVLLLAVLLAFVRLARGPSLPVRALALDLMATTGIGLIAVFAVIADRPVVLDVAIVLAMTSFLATVAFAYYVERRR